MADAPRHLVVVGASLAGLRAVEEARARGFDGALTLVGSEVHAPYDRPPLSKEYLAVGGPLEPPHFDGVASLAATHDVDVRLGAPAHTLDVRARTIGVGAETLAWDAVILATGAAPRTLPGTERLRGVHVLRTVDDARAIRTALDDGARTVVIGAGFIGSEVAAAARARDLPVTVLEGLPTPLVRAVGATAGGALAALHARFGTVLRCSTAVVGLEGADHVTGVRLADGSVVPADLVVVGIGAAPTTGWLAGSGLTLDDGVVCDATLAAAPGVWAAGDVARFHHPDFDLALRLEHWTNAGDQGAHAAANAIEPEGVTTYRHVPYFWSDWYGQRIQFAGLPEGEPTLVHGDWTDHAFTALYRRDDRLIGVLTLNRRGDVMKYRSQIARGATFEAALHFAASRAAAVA